MGIINVLCGKIDATCPTYIGSLSKIHKLHANSKNLGETPFKRFFQKVTRHLHIGTILLPISCLPPAPPSATMPG